MNHTTDTITRWNEDRLAFIRSEAERRARYAEACRANALGRAQRASEVTADAPLPLPLIAPPLPAGRPPAHPPRPTSVSARAGSMPAPTKIP